MSGSPLISIVVLTYNSALYVESTLNSIYRQNYDGELELIIGDDCSKDDTIAICENWLSRNRSRFVRCEVVRAPENRGVVANINSCYKKCSGDWIKVIAGDDILMDDALVTLLQAAVEHKVSFAYSALRTFTDDSDILSPEKLTYSSGGPGDAFVDLEYVYRKPNFWVNAPTFFVASELLKEIGYVPELFRNIEDRPLFAKILASGYTIWHCSSPTVFYRVHSQSISSSGATGRYAECNWLTYKRILRSCYPFCRRIDLDLRMLPLWILGRTGRKNVFYRVFRLFMQLLWLIWRACTFIVTRK